MYKLIYLILSGSALGLLALEAPRGEVLTLAPDRPEVGAAPSGAVGSARGGRGGAAFIYLGGGYRGGK